MPRGTVAVYCRVRPPGANPAMVVTGTPSSYFKIDYNEGRLGLDIPRDIPGTKPSYAFTFDDIFDPEATQEQVYDKLARPLLEDFLAGYNCTVFCYGQTGSGKTYTMTGGGSSYTDRGLMPRALEQLYAHIEKAKDTREFEVWISYLQILNEGGFDLLGVPGDAGARLEDLPRVTLLEDSDGALHTKGLSAHRADNVEAGLNILWNGDLNRVVSATSQNQASSRSHCIFTVHLRSREPGASLVRQSKFNFVDLAGSERVSKTQADGLVLQQAKYINVSLFYLEQVIQALSRKQHEPDLFVPYRNSMMTMFLRDSIGGNCRTAMLATVAVEKQNLQETVSTCAFAMNVGQIQNSAVINEDVDPKILVRRLKAENKALKEELRLLKQGVGASADRNISPDEIELLRQQLEKFLSTPSVQTLDVGSWHKLQYALRLLRDMYAERGAGGAAAAAAAAAEGAEGASAETAGAGRSAAPAATSGDPGDLQAEIDRLRRILQQRDAEIEILTGMVGAGATGAAGGGIGAPAGVGGAAGPMYSYDSIENEYTAEGGGDPEAGAAFSGSGGEAVELHYPGEASGRSSARSSARTARSSNAPSRQSPRASEGGMGGERGGERGGGREAAAQPAGQAGQQRAPWPRPPPAPSAGATTGTTAGTQASPGGAPGSAAPASPASPAQPQPADEFDVLSDPSRYAAIDVATLTVGDLKNERKIFSDFIDKYYLRTRLEEEKAQLRGLYQEAKALAASVTGLKAQAEKAKEAILEIVERCGKETEESDLLKEELQRISRQYREDLEGLKGKKVAIESLEAELQRAKREIKNDFIRWYTYAAQAVAARERELERRAAEYTGDRDIDGDIQAFYDAKRRMGL